MPYLNRNGHIMAGHCDQSYDDSPTTTIQWIDAIQKAKNQGHDRIDIMGCVPYSVENIVEKVYRGNIGQVTNPPSDPHLFNNSRTRKIKR